MAFVFILMGTICFFSIFVALIKPSLYKRRDGTQIPRQQAMTYSFFGFLGFFVMAGYFIDKEQVGNSPTQAQQEASDSVKKEASSEPVANHTDDQIKPEQLVTFPESSIACLSKDALGEVMINYSKGEVTKGNAQFLSKDNPDGECIMLSSKRTYKVISAEYNDQEHPDVGLLEIVGSGIKASKSGAWTLSITAKPVK